MWPPFPLALHLSLSLHSLSRLSLLLSDKAQDLLERLPELGIKNRVNDGIGDAVQVTQPSRQHEGRGAESAVRLLQLDTDGVDDVAREEGHPADQEDACRRRQRCKQ